VTAVNLIPTTKHRYRLIFDLTTAEKVQKQPRYRRFKAVGQQHLLVTDYLWSQFQISLRGSE